MQFILLAASLALFAASASAQTIYSKVDDGGHAAFSDQPFVAPDPEAEPEPAATGPKSPAGIMRIGSRRGAIVNATEAERRLAQAQLKRKRGLEPLAGESSGSNVNYRYWKRQEKLRHEVEQAQRRLNHVQRPQLAHQ